MAEEKDWSKYYTQPYQGGQINYNAAYRPEMDAFEAWKAQLASRVDPVMQEEQDRKLATGRAFWAGANILGNTIANIMNVNNVGKGAPSAQTYDDRAYNQMYNLWRDTDARLFAQRRHAQDKYDAANMSLAKLRANIAEKEAAQQQAIANENAKIDRANAALKNRLDATHSQHPEWGDDDVYNYVVSNGKILPDDYRKQLAKEEEESAIRRHNSYNSSTPRDFNTNFGKYTVEGSSISDKNTNDEKLRNVITEYVRENPGKFKRLQQHRRKNEDDEWFTDSYEEIVDAYNMGDPEEFAKQSGLYSDAAFLDLLYKEFGNKIKGGILTDIGLARDKQTINNSFNRNKKGSNSGKVTPKSNGENNFDTFFGN